MRIGPDFVGDAHDIRFRVSACGINKNMTQMVEAIYTAGVLKLLEALTLADQQRVRVTIETVEARPPGERKAAVQRLMDRLAKSTFSYGGPLPTREELHARG